MSQLFSVTEVAERLGCDPATIRRACAKNGIGRRIARTWVLTDNDETQLQRIVRDRPGNPNFVPGNYFGKTRKKAKKTSK